MRTGRVRIIGAMLGVATGCALLAAPAARSTGEARTAQRSVLATKEQLSREALALRVLASAPVRQEIARIEQLYQRDPQGSTPTGAATIRRAAGSIALAAVQYVINGDPARPAAMWVVNAPHRWFGLDVPGSGYGIDNPDNVYRNIPVGGASRYEIRGRVMRPGPVEQHFALMDSVPGTKPLAVEGGTVLATLRSDQMAIAPDGSFVITMDSAPANGRPNHLRLPPQGDLLLIVRDLFTDWATQSPVALEVRRLSGPSMPRPGFGALATRAANLLAAIGPYWLAYDNRFIFSKPVNAFNPPRNRPGSRGFSTSGHFSLGPDEALVVTLDPLGATSLGVQLTDPWGVAYDYVNRTSSLNNAQAKRNADGTFTFAISTRDPGFHNWLDPEGFSAGIYAIRWQGLPAGADPKLAVRNVERVRIDMLRALLPPGAAWLTVEQRRSQRAERARQYARRLGR